MRTRKNYKMSTTVFVQRSFYSSTNKILPKRCSKEKCKVLRERNQTDCPSTHDKFPREHKEVFCLSAFVSVLFSAPCFKENTSIFFKLFLQNPRICKTIYIVQSVLTDSIKFCMLLLSYLPKIEPSLYAAIALYLDVYI